MRRLKKQGVPNDDADQFAFWDNIMAPSSTDDVIFLKSDDFSNSN